MVAVNGDDIRQLERQSIREFLHDHRHLLKGRVLDYGCGQEPYRDLVEDAGGLYLGFDRSKFPANVSGQDIGALGDVYDVVICTQVVQYIPQVYMLLTRFHGWLAETKGTLLMTGPTNWPEVEGDDLHRFTRAGIARLADKAGFLAIECSTRHFLPAVPGFGLSLGWKLRATAG